MNLWHAYNQLLHAMLLLSSVMPQNIWVRFGNSHLIRLQLIMVNSSMIGTSIMFKS